ncbi:MAG TPA: bacteriohemerythrin [Capillibacterium sp.]
MSVQWLPEYAVGVPEIDRQHQELFSKINDLLEACNRGEGKQVLGEVLAFLGKYVKVHFGTEERMMIAEAYPEYALHRGEHQEFIQNFNQLNEKFEADGPGIWLLAQTNRVVVDWLINHITKTDIKLGNFLRAKQK